MLMTYDGPGGLRGAVERSVCVLTELDVADRGTILDNDTPEDFERLKQFSECTAKRSCQADSEYRQNR